MSTEWIARAAHQQQIAWLGGSRHDVIFDGTATEGRLSAVRSRMLTGAASPIHVHDHDDETVFVLTGSGVFWVGDGRFELGAGDSAFLPRHVPHGYLFTEDADILTVCNPSGVETFFRTVGWDLKDPLPQDWAVDMDALRAAGEAQGQHVLGPPLRAGDEMPPHYLS